MKKWTAMMLGVLMLAILCAGGALADDTRGVIYTDEADGAVAMHETASEDSAVLMNYYGGTAVTVLASEGDWTQIRVGTDNASLTGYVPSDAVRGVEVLRERRWAAHQIAPERIKVYAAPDADAEVIHDETVDGGTALNICGYNDEWVQRCSDGRRKGGAWVCGADEGFMRRFAVEISSVMPYEDAFEYTVEPLEGELTHEQAYELAIGYALDNPEWLERFDEDERGEESLRTLWWNVQCQYVISTGETHWLVYLQDAEEGGIKNVMIDMDRDGKLMDMFSGNG